MRGVTLNKEPVHRTMIGGRKLYLTDVQVNVLYRLQGNSSMYIHRRSYTNKPDSYFFDHYGLEVGIVSAPTVAKLVKLGILEDKTDEDMRWLESKYYLTETGQNWAG